MVVFVFEKGHGISASEVSVWHFLSSVAKALGVAVKLGSVLHLVKPNGCPEERLGNFASDRGTI